jgi:hypothetical protein
MISMSVRLTIRVLYLSFSEGFLINPILKEDIMAKNKMEFENDMVKLLGLPEATIWFDLKCKVNETPTVMCEYEVQNIKNGLIETIRKKYEIILEEIKGENNV